MRVSLKVETSRRANAAAEDIYEYILEKSGFKQRAKRFVNKLLVKARSLGPVAESIRVFYVSPRTDYEYRSIPYRKYRIVYTIQGERVIIVDFFHGARSQESLERSLKNFQP